MMDAAAAQRDIIGGDDSRDKRQMLYEHGQDKLGKLVLADERDREEYGEHLVAVIKDNLTDHPVVGVNGSQTLLLEGKCHECGSNRVERGMLEPAGEVFIACAVCGRERRNGHDIEIGGDD